MSVTEGSDYGDSEMKPGSPSSDTVQYEMLPSGSQSVTESYTTYQILPSGFPPGTDDDTLKYDVLPSGSQPGADSYMVNCETLPSGSDSGATDQDDAGIQSLEFSFQDFPVLPLRTIIGYRWPGTAFELCSSISSC